MKHTRDELVDLSLVLGAKNVGEETLDITSDLVNLGESTVDVGDGSAGHSGDNGEHSGDSSELHCD